MLGYLLATAFQTKREDSHGKKFEWTNPITTITMISLPHTSLRLSQLLPVIHGTED